VLVPFEGTRIEDVGESKPVGFSDDMVTGGDCMRGRASVVVDVDEFESSPFVARQSNSGDILSRVSAQSGATSRCKSLYKIYRFCVAFRLVM
jgi:hypothetical protein